MEHLKETPYVLESGQVVKLPLRYKNWKWMMATFAVPSKQELKKLNLSKKPIQVFFAENLESALPLAEESLPS